MRIYAVFLKSTESLAGTKRCLYLSLAATLFLCLQLQVAVFAEKPGQAAGSAHSLLQSGDVDGAAKSSAQDKGSKPRTASELLSRAIALYFTDQRFLAQKLLSQAASDYPQEIHLKVLASILESDFESAKKHLNAKNQFDSQNKVFSNTEITLRALQEAEEEAYTKSIQSCKEILKREPANFTARALLTRTLLRNKSNMQAVAEASKLIQSYPESAYAHHLLSCARLANSDFDPALLQAEIAHKLCPDSLLYLALRQACLRNSRKSYKLKNLLSALAANSDSPNEKKAEHEYATALALKHMQEPSMALAHFRKAAKLAAKDPYKQIAYASFLLKTHGELNKSKYYFEKAQSLLPELKSADCGLFEIELLKEAKVQSSFSTSSNSLACELCKLNYLVRQESRKSSSEIERVCLNVLAKDPANARASTILSGQLSLQGKDDEALALLNKVIDSYAANQEVLESKALILAGKQRFKEACETYAEALLMDPAVTNLKYHQLPQETLKELAPIFDMALATRKSAFIEFMKADYSFYNKEWRSKTGELLEQGLAGCKRAIEYLRYVNLFRFFQNIAKAGSIEEKCLELFPYDDRVLLAKAFLLLQEADPKQKTEMALKAVENAPGSPEALILLAKIYVEQNKISQAISLTEQALAVDPYNIDALREGAGIYNSAGKIADFSRNYLKRASQDCTANPDIIELLVIWRQHPLEERLANALKLKELDPDRSIAYTVAFDSYKSSQNLNGCRRIIKEGESRKFKGIEIMKRKGELANMAGDYASAVRLLSQTLNMECKETSIIRELLEERAYAYFKLKQYEASLKDLDQYIKISPAGDSKLHAAFQTRAKVHIEMKKYDDALEDYSNAIAHANFPAPDYFRRAELYFKLSKLEKAKADLKNSIKKEPANPKAHLLLSEILRVQGATKEADSEAELAKKYSK